MYTGLWWESEEERGHLEYLHMSGKIILKLILEKYVGVVQTGFI
jgi:hypothetical protein